MSNNENDKNEIIECIAKFYRLFSGRIEDKRDWSEFSNLFTENATISIVKKENKINITTLNVDDYIARLNGYLENNDFWEHGSGYQVTISNSIANVSSSYEASSESDYNEIIKGGTNFIQLIKIDNNWKIFSMLYMDDV